MCSLVNFRHLRIWTHAKFIVIKDWFRWPRTYANAFEQLPKMNIDIDDYSSATEQQRERKSTNWPTKLRSNKEINKQTINNHGWWCGWYNSQKWHINTIFMLFEMKTRRRRKKEIRTNTCIFAIYLYIGLDYILVKSET